jgi:hypothetical protein
MEMPPAPEAAVIDQHLLEHSLQSGGDARSRSPAAQGSYGGVGLRNELNLAPADVRVLAEALERAVHYEDADMLDPYGPPAPARVWKAQHFSYWMTSMLHALPGATDFDLRRQLGELESVASSVAGSTYLAEAYTGWPSR